MYKLLQAESMGSGCISNSTHRMRAPCKAVQLYCLGSSPTQQPLIFFSSKNISSLCIFQQVLNRVCGYNQPVVMPGCHIPTFCCALCILSRHARNPLESMAFWFTSPGDARKLVPCVSYADAQGLCVPLIRFRHKINLVKLR